MLRITSTYYKYLAFFRVFLALHILKKYLFYFPVINEVLGEDALVGKTSDYLLHFFNISNSHATIVLTMLLVTAILMLFGIGKNITIIVVYVLVEIAQRLNGYILNGGDNFMKFLLIYMIFANSFTRLTLFKSSEECKPNTISFLLNNLSVLSIKIHLCLVYFISGLFKINSKVWFNGVATYYTLSLERFSGSSINKILVQNGLFVTISTYVTMYWEIFFPALVWQKALKYWMLGIGVLMHVGIYFLMMIHDFEIIFVATYGFFISDAEWIAIGEKLSKFAAYRKLKMQLNKLRFE
ncbi:hypothetical protein [Ascidiimonas sp. W6]|uniref:hypothetical protein n=1 Tax=Ascidiimonas meishanensis TaxID=3128903 RepID=UPI0030ED4B09